MTAITTGGPYGRADTADAVIRVRGLRKAYGKTTAVDGIDLDVRRGEVFAFLGPNGAGKTTTVEILEGYRRRDAGEVAVLGADPQHAGAAWRARVGVVLQEATDAGELSVKEVVEHFAKYYPDPRDPAEAIALVGLTEKARTRVQALSGGQRRRLDVALGILGHPELIFLDEPTTGFDPEARRQFWDLVRLLGTEGSTVVLTTHYLEEAEALADRLAVIARGRVVALDTPAALGGRASAAATVTWRDATDGGNQDGNQGSDHGADHESGQVMSQRTTEPTRLVVELARRYGGEVPALTVRRPSLEDVYLDLIDHQKAEPEGGRGAGPRTGPPGAGTQRSGRVDPYDDPRTREEIRA